MRIKDGNEDEPETEIGENFEILLQFVLDCRQLPAAEAIEKYFVADSTLSLSNNALRKELKSGSKDPEKLKEAEDDVKNVSAIKMVLNTVFLYDDRSFILKRKVRGTSTLKGSHFQ